MKLSKIVIALFAVLALFATSCGAAEDAAEKVADTAGDVAEAGKDAGEAVADTAKDTAEDVKDAVTGEDSEAEEATEEESAAAVEASTAGEGGHLQLLQWQAPSQLNALLSNGTKDQLASSLVLEPLANVAPDGSLVPRLAVEIPTVENGGVAEDFSSITWKLLPEVVWSDGTPLTADDVVFTYEYCDDPATGCGADRYITVESMEAIDDLTVKINFVDPQPYPYDAFVTYGAPVIQKAQFQDCVGEAGVACSEQNFAPIGTGPYMVTSFRPEDTVTYEMNPLYRGVSEGKPFFGTVEIKGGGDAEATARSVLEIGEADYAWNLQVAPDILGPMETAGLGHIKVGLAANVEHLNLNQTNNRNEENPSDFLGGNNPNPFFFENTEFARALSLAIDRQELVDVGYGATGTPTCNIWPVGAQASTNNDWCLTQDIDEANRILDDLGYLDTDGDGIRELPDGTPLQFGYVTSTNAVRQSNQELVKSYWAQIGVGADLTNEDASLFFDGTSASDVSIWKFFNDIQMFTNGASSPNAAQYLGGWRSANIPTPETSWGGDNMPRMNNAEYDELWEELSATDLSDPRYNEIVIRLNDILSAESGAIIPLIHRGTPAAFANSIQGVGTLNGWDSEYWNIADWTREG